MPPRVRDKTSSIECITSSFSQRTTPSSLPLCRSLRAINSSKPSICRSCGRTCSRKKRMASSSLAGEASTVVTCACMPPLLPCEVAYERAYGTLGPPIDRPLDLVADDVVDPIGGDEEGPVCVLCSRGYLKGLVLSQLLRDLRESILGFVWAFIDSIDHTSEGRGLINARSSTGGLGTASGGALHRFSLVRLLAGIDQPYHHTISHVLILLCCALLYEIVTIARIAPLLGGLVHRVPPSLQSPTPLRERLRRAHRGHGGVGCSGANQGSRIFMHHYNM